MDLKKIRALLEKFYNGESTLEEENVLKDYFSNELIDDEFIADKDIFLYQIQENENNQNIPDISDEIWNKLHSEKYNNTKINNKIVYFYLRIAASIIVIVGSFFLIKNQVFNKSTDLQFAVDTYDDPQLAYQQAKETLLYVSAMLNTGTKHLEPITKIDEGTKPLNSLTTFNKGLNELRPITEYNKADKYFKQ